MQTDVKTHIGSYGIITKDGKIALIRKARGGYLGKLDLPGGGIEHTETPLEALIREIDEEVGGTVVKHQLLDVTSVNIKWQREPEVIEDLHHIGALYLVEIKETTLKEDADGLDSNGAAWYDINMLEEDGLSPFAAKAVKYLKEASCSNK